MGKGKALKLDGLRPLFLYVYASETVGWVSVPGAGRILCEKKACVVFPICKGERAERA